MAGERRATLRPASEPTNDEGATLARDGRRGPFPFCALQRLARAIPSLALPSAASAGNTRWRGMQSCSRIDEHSLVFRAKDD